MAHLWGRDPIVRWLRTFSVLAFLGLIIVVVLDPARASDTPLVALLAGVILVQLGYEIAIPGLTRIRKDEDDRDH